MRERRIALAGNPNAGKTTIFNALTGSNQHVGNWPGKTVERKTGKFRYDDCEVELVDLPGTYSLSAYSPEEMIARDFILNESPDLVVIVVDAANLERNLYLAVQVLELEVPSVIVLNMIDMAEARGFQIDTNQLSQTLQVPVVTAVARKGRGIKEIKELMVNSDQQKTMPYEFA
jgi:ferrous iron transport protein B